LVQERLKQGVIASIKKGDIYWRSGQSSDARNPAKSPTDYNHSGFGAKISIHIFHGRKLSVVAALPARIAPNFTRHRMIYPPLSQMFIEPKVQDSASLVGESQDYRNQRLKKTKRTNNPK